VQEKLALIPVRTHIVTEKDDIVDVIEKYAGPSVGPGDVVSVAESVVAITQGRFRRPEEMNPGFWSRVLCRFMHRDSSLSSCYGMQVAMDEGGTLRVIYAFIIGAIAKVFGKPGVFYMLAGEQAALIDDVTGTMPPFDKYLVYGPKDPKNVAERIKSRLNCYGAAVADVNDLKRAAVLGVTEGLEPKELSRILIDNPFGNANEQTPIVIIKNYAAAAARG
jgi:F420-0:gamma-glutamyl ligase-like protein